MRIHMDLYPQPCCKERIGLIELVRYLPSQLVAGLGPHQLILRVVEGMQRQVLHLQHKTIYNLKTAQRKKLANDLITYLSYID